MSLEIKLLSLSVEIINRYEKVKGKKNITSTELYNLFNVKPLEKSECIKGSLAHVIKEMKQAVTHSDIIMAFLGLLSYPITYEGNVDKEGNIDPSSVSMHTIKDVNIARKEIENTINKTIDGAVVLMQEKSLNGINYYFKMIRESVEYNSRLKELSDKFFFKSWNELKSVWSKIYPNEYNKFDSVILDEMRLNFKDFQYNVPKVSLLWNLYLFNELEENLSSDIDWKSFPSKDISNVIRAKYKEGYRDKVVFTKNQVKKLKRFMLSFNRLESLPDEISKGTNKSLCINLFNDQTSLIETFLLSMYNEKIMPLPRKVTYNRNGKLAVKYVNRTAVNFDKKMGLREIENIGQSTIINYTGLVHRFLSSKRRDDYDYNLLTLAALRCIWEYIYDIFNVYIDENNLKLNIKGVESEDFLKCDYIFDELGEIETDTECINFITQRLNSHKIINYGKFLTAYEYLLNTVFLSKDRILGKNNKN